MGMVMSSDNDDGRHDENRSYLQDQPSLMITMMMITSMMTMMMTMMMLDDDAGRKWGW